MKKDQASFSSYCGVFLISLAVICFEILLTRIFSATMWYHFAFLVISITMFGLTAGGILLYLFPKFFSPEKTHEHMGLSAFLFSATAVLGALTHFCVPFYWKHSFWLTVALMLVTFVAIAIPFVCSGVCIALVLTRFPKQVSKLYAVDLVGAALGCLLLIEILRYLDAPTAVFLVAALGSLAALCFLVPVPAVKLKRGSTVLLVFLLVIVVLNNYLVERNSPIITLPWSKGERAPKTVYDKWNSFSRVTVIKDFSRVDQRPFGWGLSYNYASNQKVEQLLLTIDGSAGTPITRFDGEDLSPLTHLKYDVTNIAHYLRGKADVFVMGIGGGRDILSALVFKQKSVVGTEYNDTIISALTKDFSAYAGHLQNYPQVKLVNAEARNYLLTHPQNYDLIQISLIDTWAATAAGAFVFAENGLYTTQAWKLFLERLTDRGILSVSRWYLGLRPYEMYRLAGLAATTLKSAGIPAPEEHILIVRHLDRSGTFGMHSGVGTLLVAKEPFSPSDIATLQAVCEKMDFDLIFSAQGTNDPFYSKVIKANNLAQLSESLPLNITPPTDDKPFFFHMLRLKDVLFGELELSGDHAANLNAVKILGALFVVVVILTILCIILPLVCISKPIPEGHASLPLLSFFALIGLGFMLVEISQMQKLNIFLGHPVYGLSVVLFTLLLGSGLGSFSTNIMKESTLKRSALIRLVLLLIFLLAYSALMPACLTAFESAVVTTRIFVVSVLLIPLGFFLGMAFPIGMKIAALAGLQPLTPWFWGINGATSVCASVLAMLIALTAGITASFWIGGACYAIALGALYLAVRPGGSSCGLVKNARQ